jgi:GntR family transcriptional regulator/MocR family aminotransferase
LKRAVEVAVPTLSLDRRRPLVPQISEGLRAAIQSGRLKPNDRVPATRALAQVLGVSRQVIVSAYEELVATGHLRGRTGDGSYVACGESQPEAFGRARVIADPDGYAILIWPLR